MYCSLVVRCLRWDMRTGTEGWSLGLGFPRFMSFLESVTREESSRERPVVSSVRSVDGLCFDICMGIIYYIRERSLK